MFGQGGNKTPFAFGTPSTSTTQASSGGLFGNNPAASTTKPGGFAFGTPGQTSASAVGGGQTGGFSFNAPAASTSAPNLTGGGGFTFGTPGQTTAGQTGGFSLGTTSGQSTAAGGFNFGGTQQPAAATATAAATGGFTLGGSAASSTGGVALGTPGQTTTAATFGTPGQTTAPAATGGFGLGTSSTPSTGGGFGLGTSSTPSTGGLLVKPLGQTTQPSATTTATTGLSLSGGFNLGGATQPKTTAPTTGGATGGPSLGFGATPASTTTSTGLLPTPQKPATATSAPTGLSLGGLLAAKTTTSGLSLGLTTASTAASSSATATVTSTAASTAAPQKQITYQQLEDNINKWLADLDQQEKEFLEQATQVNAWDRLLIENGEKITTLNSDMERVKMDQQKLDHELDFIKSQQQELEELLVPLEKSVEQQPNINYQQHADLEREHTYQLAENVDAQLKRMVQDLKEIIDHLNITNTTQDNNDPIQQITKILNSHMDSLQWIDMNTALLGRKVDEISKQMEMQRKEQEKNFRLVYN